jgi:hypothetical protein
MWADRIIVSDQGSTDGSKEIARGFPKVTLIHNTSEDYNEVKRQQMLIAEARRCEGQKILFALDADEFLTANFLTTPEWKTIIHSPPGTVISLQWPGVQADFSGLRYSNFPAQIAVGFVDDGSEHSGKTIHSTRVPAPASAPVLAPTQIKLMHYCQHDRERFASRIRWYQCYEYLTLKKRPIELYRFYQQDLFGPWNTIKPVPREWIQGYEDQGIDMSSVTRQPDYYWDREVLGYFEKYGTTRFRRLAVWDVNWEQLYRALYSKEAAQSFADPRSPADRLVHRWLKMTQPDWSHHARPSFGRKLVQRWVQNALRLMGW